MAKEKDTKKKGSNIDNIRWGAKKSGNSGTWWEDTNTGYGGRTSVARDSSGKPTHLYGHYTEKDVAGNQKDVTGGFNAGQASKLPNWVQDAVNLADKLFGEKSSK
jgi:hypothetical protein